jgi:hypothetical protein
MARKIKITSVVSFGNRTAEVIVGNQTKHIRSFFVKGKNKDGKETTKKEWRDIQGNVYSAINQEG